MSNPYRTPSKLPLTLADDLRNIASAKKFELELNEQRIKRDRLAKELSIVKEMLGPIYNFCIEEAKKLAVRGGLVANLRYGNLLPIEQVRLFVNLGRLLLTNKLMADGFVATKLGYSDNSITISFSWEKGSVG